MDWKAVSSELGKKLDPAHVKPAKSYGPKGDYIEGWHAIAEANRIFGFGEWSYEVLNVSCVAEMPREVGQQKKPGFGVTYTALVRVRVGEALRDDVGAGHGYDVDKGLAHESAIKEAVTDALKRSLRTFGNPFGLALYDKSRENVGPPEPEKKQEPEKKPAPPKDEAPRLSEAAQTLVAAIGRAPTEKDARDLTTKPKLVEAMRKLAGPDLEAVANAYWKRNLEFDLINGAISIGPKPDGEMFGM